jgi:hypothetical protein
MEEKPANTPVSIWSDATDPNIMVTGSRFVFDCPRTDRIFVMQRILELTFTKEHDTAMTAAGTVYRVLTKFEQAPESVLGHMRDTVSMNGALDDLLRAIGNFCRLFSLPCFPHLGANTGNKLLEDGCHPVLGIFWGAYQNVLRSNAACDLFKEVTGESVEKYSAIKW